MVSRITKALIERGESLDEIDKKSDSLRNSVKKVKKRAATEEAGCFKSTCILLAVFSGLAWIFIFYLLPETANKEITQILKEI